MNRINSKLTFNNKNEPDTPPINNRERSKEVDYKSEINIKNNSINQDDELFLSKLDQSYINKVNQKDHSKTKSMSIPLTKNKHIRDKSVTITIKSGIPDEKALNER